MTGLPIGAIGAISADTSVAAPIHVAGAKGAASFGQLLAGGLDQANQNLLDANSLASAFATDDSIPLHQVTYALEKASLSLDLLTQIRSRLVEGYQDIMRMQL